VTVAAALSQLKIKKKLKIVTPNTNASQSYAASSFCYSITCHATRVKTDRYWIYYSKGIEG